MMDDLGMLVMDDKVDGVARVLHGEFRDYMKLVKSQMGAYVLSTYKLHKDYIISESEGSISITKVNPFVNEADSCLLEDVWTSYIKFTDFMLLNVVGYDKPYDKLDDEHKAKFTELAERIIK